MFVAAVLVGSMLRGPSPLHVEGPRILNERNEAVSLRGVNTACLEWSTDGEGHVLETLKVAIRDWQSNIIRLPLSQDRWFGMASDQKDDGTAYRALVKKCVDYVAGQRAYIMLDLHWNNADVWGQNIGQHVMPDSNSVVFWKSCATLYKNHPAVLFDLYNEPHNTTWDIWRDGGTITENSRVGAGQGAQVGPKVYKTPGMQKLLDTVRAVGAKNVIVCGGLDWSYDMKGFLEGYTLKDPSGNGVIYANHAYNNKGDAVSTWLAKMEAATAKLPVIVSEFGGQNRGATIKEPNAWVKQVIDIIHAHKWNYTAWDLHPAAGPTLVSDWKYTPTPSFGVLVKDDLAKKVEL